MQLGMIGLGRMGGSIVQRLLRGGHGCVVFDSQPASVALLTHHGATGSHSLEEFINALDAPRVVWLMLPAAAVETMLHELSPYLQAGDVVVDGGNSHYVDDIRRAKALEARGIYYLDAGVSGGVWGVERGYCLMIGGAGAAVARLDPIFKTLAPGFGVGARTPGRDAGNSTADEGYMQCGPAGAGHFVKMVHNGISLMVNSSVSSSAAMRNVRRTNNRDAWASFGRVGLVRGLARMRLRKLGPADAGRLAADAGGWFEPTVAWRFCGPETVRFK